METEPTESTTTTIEQKGDNDQLSNMELRQRFLRFLQWLPNRSVNVQLFGDIQVDGKFVAVEPCNFEYYLVDDLKTPIGVIDHATLRIRDSVYLEIPLNEDEENDEKTKKLLEEMEQPKMQ